MNYTPLPGSRVSLRVTSPASRVQQLPVPPFHLSPLQNTAVTVHPGLSSLSLTVIFNPSIPKIINLTALLTILHTSNISTSLIALSRPISFLLQSRSNSFLHLHMGLPAFYATKSSTTVFGFVCVWASTLRGINSLVPDRSISQDYQDSSERGGLLIIPLIPLLSIPLLFRCSKRFHILNITSQIFKGTVSSKTILKGIIILKITLKWTVDPNI